MKPISLRAMTSLMDDFVELEVALDLLYTANALERPQDASYLSETIAKVADKMSHLASVLADDCDLQVQREHMRRSVHEKATVFRDPSSDR